MCQLREERGRKIAETCKIKQRGKLWAVPSQSGDRHYLVNLQREYCNCPDFIERGEPCKHVYAARIVVQRTQRHADGSETVSTLTVEAKVERKSYPQDWTNYNKAQVNEHRLFQSFLFDLCRNLPAPAPKPGRPPVNPADGAFYACLKVYSTMSARRFMGDLDEAHAAGYVSRIPHFNSVLRFLDTEDATPILQEFIDRSAAPLAGIERTFAADSTGFSANRYNRWFDEKYGRPRSKQKWVKVHAMVGTTTGVVTAATILDQHASDGAQLPGLVERTAKTFAVAEVSADKAYCSRKNFDAVESHGAAFYPAFRKDTTGNVGGAFQKAFHLFKANEDEYNRHYHLRSNVESVFSSVKRRFGEAVRAKNDVSMRNEALAKLVCHNVTCVIAGMYELGIAPTFTKTSCTYTEEVAHVLPFRR